MHTKNNNPGAHFDELSPVLKTYAEITHLKQLYRRGWLLRGIPPEQCESVAEHTFGVTMLAYLLAKKYFPELDLDRVLRLALLHDLGEVYAGDIVPSDGLEGQEKKQLEHAALQRLCADLPDGNEIIQLWEEYEQGQSPEARFVQQADKLEMAIQARVYEIQEDRSLDEFYQSAAGAIQDPQLSALLAELAASREIARE